MTGDFVLAADAPALAAFNRTVAPAAQFDVSLYPEPYFGRLDAPVVLLALNPGRGDADAMTHADATFAAAARASLQHTLRPLPFLHFQQPESTPGGAWWRRIAKPLIAATSLDAVATSIMCVQYLGYHSRTFSARKLRLPSQDYGFQLVRDAMQRGAIVVCMRSWRLWSRAIPALLTYEPRYHVRNVRNPVLSSANLPSGYEAILAAVLRHHSDDRTGPG